MHRNKSFVIAGLAVLGSVSLARGALVRVAVLGEDLSENENSFVSSLNVRPGDQVVYEVELEMSPVGTSDNGHLILALVPGVDGVSSASFNVSGNNAPLQAGTFSLASVFDQGTASVGRAGAGNTQQGIFAFVGPSGVPQGVGAGGNAGAEVVVGAGDATAGNLSTTIAAAFGTMTGTFTISDGLRVSTGVSDPSGYFSFAPLTLTDVNPQIVSLGSGVPSGFGSSEGMLSITGHNGNYKPGAIHFAATSSGYAAISSFSPSTDIEEFALDVHGATGPVVGHRHRY